MGERSKSERSIFEAAIEVGSAAARAAYLDRACGTNEGLRQDVKALLAAHDRLGSISIAAHAPAALASALEPIRECPGTLIGPYKLLEQIGEGGFGVVFMAEQQQPVRRKVALKVLKPGMDTRQVVARFEAERQALALMDHPHIAHVFDGGETATGRPYFVMELVKGLPITDFCDQARWSVRERLELFITVCQAVQHAHQKGIIHRDLKPSNVMVTLHDGTPVVKIIDFGIAKATGQQLTEKTLLTNFAQLIGTPLYMSPEQAALSGLDVDTRSDIYSLGVLLYELLTGTTPFDKERLGTATFDEIRRIIREEEPPKPSTRISTLGQAVATLSTQRKCDPNALTRLFRGELDWIVMKCLEKARTRRYETANALARDIERFMRDEPVQACPPSKSYRLRKFARRNKVGLAVAGLILGFLVLLGSGIGWLARDRAARLVAIENNVHLALEDSATFKRQAKWPESLEALKRAEGFLAGGASQELRERVRELRKDVEMVLRLEDIRLPRAAGGAEGAYDIAGADAAYAKAFRDYGIDVESLEPAVAGERIRAKTIRLELAVALDNWARKRQRTRKADALCWKRLVVVARAADPDEWRDQVRAAVLRSDHKALANLAASENIRDLPLQTLSLLGEVLPHEQGMAVLQLAHHRYPDEFWINFQLAWVFEYSAPPQRDLHEASRFYTVALALRPRNVPTHLFLGAALARCGKPDEARAVYRRVIDLAPENALAHYNLACILQAKGKVDAAIAEYLEAGRLQKDFPAAHYHLGNALAFKGQRESAIAAYCKAIASAPQHAAAHNNLAWLLATCPDPKVRDPARAIDLAKKAVVLAPKQAKYWNTLGIAHYRAGDWEAANHALKQSMGLGHPEPSYNWFFLAMIQGQLGHHAEARTWYVKAVRWMDKNQTKNEELSCFRAEAKRYLSTPRDPQ
jgi:serine/threonine protein kinase/Flp pilus assembly protein TadD